MGENKKTFSNFTNLYELSKTLRFELKPVGETDKLLRENQVFGKDEIIANSYTKIKPYLDLLHVQFIEESLKNLHLDFSETEKIFLEWQKETDKTKKSKLKKELSGENGKGGEFGKLRKQIGECFTENGKNWKNIYESKTYRDKKGKEKNYKIKGEGYKILLSDTNLDILSEVFIKEKEGENILVKNIKGEKENLFKSFKGFTTYFTNFNHSRENFYKDDGKAGRIATRIIDENLIFFLKNKKSFDEKYRDNIDFIEDCNAVLQENYGEKVENIFSLEFYNACYNGKQIEYYNQIIGELNSVINNKKLADYSKHIQEKKSGKESEFKKQNYPIFKELYKQILSEKSQEQKFIEIENFDDIKKYLEEFDKKNTEKIELAKNLIYGLSENIQNNEYEFEKIYFSKLSLNTLSAKFFGSNKWFFVQEKLLDKLGKKNKNGKQDLPDFIKLSDIQEALEKAQKESEEDIFKEDFKSINSENVFLKFLTIFRNELGENIQNNEVYFGKIKENILNISYFSEKKEEKEKQVEYIKNYLDSSLNIYRMMKYFALEKGKQKFEPDEGIDNIFYNQFDTFYVDNEIISYYNEFRNYLTKKTFSQNKIKLNFENGTLIDGWDKNKEPDNFGSLLRKDGKYFLALQVYGKKNIFYTKKGSRVEDIQEAFEVQNGEEVFEKMDYKFLPDPKKMLPKVFFAKSNLELFKPSKEILRIKKEETFKTGNNFNKDDFYKIVDFYKESISKYPDWKVFDFDFSNTKTYKNLADFYSEVEISSYNLSFRNISQNYLFENIKAGNIYLFEIYNKDFAEKKSGKENLHTMYFKGLFEKNNLQNVVLKLNGQAEIFRRQASLKSKEINRAKNNKNTSHSITENKRYTKDKLFFHCPIKLNFAKHETQINNKILEYITQNKDINIIGIDRGEKHLAYYSVIDQNGNILRDKKGNLVKGSFNVIGGKNYYKELVKREEERKDARGSWKTIGNIKDLKQGYISQVVHKLAELIIDYNAIIIFEDLNSGFKRGRQKIERQVYQKLEKALIEKLNYLTFKDKNFGENGHYLSAYQLTQGFETFEKMGKQTGVIFYTDPSYTSSTCPECGFRKDLYLKYKNLKDARGDIEKIDSITFDGEKFIFEYNNKKVFSDRERKKNSRNPEKNNQWETVNNPVTENLEKLFKEFTIDYSSGKNLISDIQEKNEKNLYEGIFYNFNAILSIRNSTIGDNSRDGDFICCPACNFDSRKENEIGIENGDDNGAYNIARKGIIITQKITEAFQKKKDISKVQWGDMIVKQEDWDNFTQDNKK